MGKHLSFGLNRKVLRGKPLPPIPPWREKSDPAAAGDERGACGNVGHGGTMNPLHEPKGCMMETLRLKLSAPYFYPTLFPQRTITVGRNNFRSIGKSQGFSKFKSRLFFRKLKKDDRWVNRTHLVWGLQPSVTMLKNCRTFSDGNSVNPIPPKSAQNLLIIHR